MTSITFSGVLIPPANKVFVTYVRSYSIILNLLASRVEPENIAGKQGELLAAIAEPLIVLVPYDATTHSECTLGVIGPQSAEVDLYRADALKLENQIAFHASRRIAVVSTGSDLLAGEIEDTNFAAIRSAIEDAEFEVEFGGIAGDSEFEIAGIVASLSGEAFGIITTGGVGAEDKDYTIEAIERLDPGLSTALLAQYKRGHVRHVKYTMRIAIGQLGWSTVFVRPGPTHELKLALPVIIEGLNAKTDRNERVLAIAIPLRSTLPHHHH